MEGVKKKNRVKKDFAPVRMIVMFEHNRNLM
jgi:hypothetical protein